MDDLISRQAAIDAIMSVKRTDNLKSVAMLIMDLPSAEPETHEERTETHACDCIDRQAAIEADRMFEREVEG